MLLTVLATSFIAHAVGVLSEADSAYSKGDYAEAIELYEKVLGEKGGSSELYYNIANSYAKCGDYGNSVLNYERSLRIDPSNKKAKANLEYVKDKVRENNKAELRGKKMSVEPDDSTFFSKIKNFIVKEHKSDTWAVWAVVFFLILMVCVALYIFTSNVLVRKIGFFGSIGLIVLVAISIIFAVMSSNYKSDEGVITAMKVKLHTEPSVGSKTGEVSLTRGTEMRMLESQGEGKEEKSWYKVRLNSDFVGWIRSSDFEAIER